MNLNNPYPSPYVKYDRSGRSSGVAIIFYETAQEAAQAKQEFNGKFAKGQPMEIEFDAGPTPRPNLNTRHAASAPSLINRIQKPPLLERLGDVTTSKSKAKPTARPAKAAAASNGPGPVRTKARPVKEKKKPKTMEQLDSELDAFMHDDDAAPSTGDVAMA
ncbi:hypothetical protein EUX98_g2105 [Antrodiella citrinella]|uniref:Chromatin target of PRMT1 protein C-terminal domain-containing protein n=1 Tax=Antrodiella citrinella TaxID=2447956 RepID=A0A4S4N1A8_9APHY|nr:hypothetical protein EUX98_g2105 [Antrodiella citrinella]